MRGAILGDSSDEMTLTLQRKLQEGGGSWTGCHLIGLVLLRPSMSLIMVFSASAV